MPATMIPSRPGAPARQPDPQALAAQLRAPASTMATGPQMTGNPDPRLSAPMGMPAPQPVPVPAPGLQAPRPFEGQMRPMGNPKYGAKSADFPPPYNPSQGMGGKSSRGAGPFRRM